MTDLYLPGGRKILSKTTPSGATYVKVRLLRAWRNREMGDEVICDIKAANYLADNMIGAILFDDNAPKRIIVPVGM